MNKERNKGITLIALVITIIVLLILAGVTIATLTGDNGLLTKAGETKKPLSAVFRVEAPSRLELENKAFAELCLTTWP